MNKLILCTLAAASLFTAQAFAAGANVPGTSQKGQQLAPLAATTPHKLLNTFVESGSASGAAASGFVPFGTPLTVKCTNTAGCTIGATLVAQLAGAATENAVAVCLKIDGSYLTCPFAGIVRAGSGFQAVTYDYSAAVALGNHTVETEVYSNVSTGLYNWGRQVRVYKPWAPAPT